uniref:PHD finger protein 7 n=1 Tax=Phallusia mammillata TaxID=59560 RepID=A0A6F9DPC3_9ASCI|nr:PHD finger protein 7 [Phallusia mammillata]
MIMSAYCRKPCHVKPKRKKQPKKASSKTEVVDSKPPQEQWWKEFGISLKDIKLLPQNDRCIFCWSSEDCEERFGELLCHFYTGLTMHYFCLLLSSGLHQTVTDEAADSSNAKDSIYGFMIKDIVQEVKRAQKLRCTFCCKRGASIGCVVHKCKTKFHFPCGLNVSVLSQFYDSFPSYCRLHRPKQSIEVSQVAAPTTLKCPICLCKVQNVSDDYHIVRTPCCANSVIHRTCVQQQAFSCGTYFFRCPVCNDSDNFSDEMKRMGIYVPERDASWELSHDAFTDLLERHSICDVKQCICPHGKDYNLKGTEWAVVLCDLCGSSGTHIACSEEVDSENSYYSCEVCTEIHGTDGAREMAVSMGVISPPKATPRRSTRRRALRSPEESTSKRSRPADGLRETTV